MSNRPNHRRARSAPPTREPYKRERIPLREMLAPIAHAERVQNTIAQRRSLRRELFDALQEPDGTVRCYVCRRPVPWEDATIEHIIPLSYGGTHARENLAISHAWCNHHRVYER